VKCLDKSSKPILFTKTREEENVADIFVDMLEKEKIIVTFPGNSEEQLIINGTCFSENRNMCR